MTGFADQIGFFHVWLCISQMENEIPRLNDADCHLFAVCGQ